MWGGGEIFAARVFRGPELWDKSRRDWSGVNFSSYCIHSSHFPPMQLGFSCLPA
jgi:hypothetical protein